jgi:hypothetical protein
LNRDIWKDIRIEYESTCTSYSRLSKKYGFSANAINNRGIKESWIKFNKVRKQIQRIATEEFLLESTVTVKDLNRIEDNTLSNLQEVVDGKVPYEKIFRSLENLKGDLIVKIDGTVKGITETAMMIGNKRRELRGELPLKDREWLAIKREELEHKKTLDKEKLDLDNKNFALGVEKANFNMEQLRIGDNTETSKLDKALDKLAEKMDIRFSE